MRAAVLSLLAFAAVLSCSCAAAQHQSPDAASVSLLEEQCKLLAQVRQELAVLEPRYIVTRGPEPEAVRFRESYKGLQTRFRAIETTVEADRSHTVCVYAGASDPQISAYYEKLKAIVERAGESNFPRNSGTFIYGYASISASITPTGEVSAVEVAESSSGAIGDHTRALLLSVSPVEPLPSAVAPSARRVLFVATFNYVRSE